MDFEPTERQAYWRDRVKNFIDAHVRPAVPTYKQQDAEGDRWKWNIWRHEHWVN